MQNNKPVIGIFSLESLTTGMYADPRVIYREYIQNATDAIDDAVEAGILPSREAGEIHVEVTKRRHSIVISDNGIGLPQAKALSTLYDIGRSSKRYDKKRGFRGIGRLAGLSYCDRLIFTTSAEGEAVATVVTWDAKEMRAMLRPDHSTDDDLAAVIEKIVSYSTVPEDVKKHYFKVELHHVDERFSQLLDESDIRSYLSQVGPVPFRADKFPYYSDKNTGIRRRVESLGKELEEYNIFINGDPNPLYKAYKTWFTTSKGKDDIREIRFFEEYHPNGDLFFWGWYGMSTFNGYVQESEVQGLRVRKHNIQIGDERTLDPLFSQARFNRWFIGEIHVYDKDIIPNARRDDFEKNDVYFDFTERLQRYTKDKLSKIPSVYSNINSAVAKIESSKSSLEEIESKIQNGVSSEAERDSLFKKRDAIKTTLDKGKKEIEKSKSKIDDQGLVAKITETLAETVQLEKKSNELENKIIDVDFNSQTAKALSAYAKDTRKVVYRIFDVIDREVDTSLSKKLQEAILTELSQGKAK